MASEKPASGRSRQGPRRNREGRHSTRPSPPPEELLRPTAKIHPVRTPSQYPSPFRRPLVRRFERPDPSSLVEALTRFDERVIGQDQLACLREELAASSGTWRDPTHVARITTLVRALYAARKIHRQQYVYLAARPIDSLVHARVMDGSYNRELDPINAHIRSLEMEHGLDREAGEYWAVGTGPSEYRRLSDLYDEVLDEKFIEALREFELDDVAALRRDEPEEFYRLVERGRRSFFENDLAAALRDLVVRCEGEAKRAASVGAYLSAVVSLGSGAEGLLILRCLQSPQKAERVASKLPRRSRPKKPREPITWHFDQLIEVCLAAGWLPPVDGSFGTYSPPGLADLLRMMRNNVHPGRQARERPWVEVDKRDYEDALAIYTIVLSALRIFRTGRQATSGRPSPEQWTN